MATYIFDKIAREQQTAGVSGVEARDWLRDRASEINSVNIRKEMTNRALTQSNITNQDIGRMFMYFYTAKTKDKLPYWDRFPCIFVVDVTADGFTGTNLHYLSPLYRARLMDSLYTIQRNDGLRKSKKLRMNYQLLSSAAKFRWFKPTFKKYLRSQVRSRYLWVPAESWDVALMLPTQRFVRTTKNRVWRDSRNAF